MMKYFEGNLPNRCAGVSRAQARNQPCCIKFVKWFYPTLIDHLESFAKLACGRHALKP
jgi:hypothetical protein